MLTWPLVSVSLFGGACGAYLYVQIKSYVRSLKLQYAMQSESQTPSFEVISLVYKVRSKSSYDLIPAAVLVCGEQVISIAAKPASLRNLGIDDADLADMIESIEVLIAWLKSKRTSETFESVAYRFTSGPGDLKVAVVTRFDGFEFNQAIERAEEGLLADLNQCFARRSISYSELAKAMADDHGGHDV